VLRKEALREGGFGGLYHIGKCAECEPALVLLSHTPAAPTAGAQTVAWVGKGIVYDTGGLSLKVGGGMVGMKSDMGGSAAMLAAFQAAVLAGVNHPLHLVMCIAENAIGAGAVSPSLSLPPSPSSLPLLSFSLSLSLSLSPSSLPLLSRPLPLAPSHRRGTRRGTGAAGRRDHAAQRQDGGNQQHGRGGAAGAGRRRLLRRLHAGAGRAGACAAAFTYSDEKLRIVTSGFGTGRQKLVLERWTNPKLSRRTCTCEYGLPSC
jgi:hypothetical protein